MGEAVEDRARDIMVAKKVNEGLEDRMYRGGM